MALDQGYKRSIPFLMSGVLLCLPWRLAAGEYDQILHDDQRVSIDYPADLSEAERQMTHRWLREVTRALRSVHGELPKDRFRFTIRRSANRSSPVPWGQVDRGDPTRVLLVINPELGYERLIGDWTAFHEVAHLLLPYRGWGDIWFSEGLATYYQNIVQARAGLLDERALWQKLVAGFERGKAQQNWDHLDLSALSDNLRDNRQFMRVHWSGVLYWLNADVELRRRGEGGLDEALKQLKDCCQTRSMSAEAIARKLDELTRQRIFHPLFKTYGDSHRLPDYEPVLAALGVWQDEGTQSVSLGDNAPLAQIRSRIYQGRSARVSLRSPP